jgi:ubiquinone/menaquinone biosynthesis C-methylase UbiE
MWAESGSMQISKRFDEAAREWDNNPTRVELARAVGVAIERAVPIQPGWHALDYGAGTGLLTLNLQPRVTSLLALDASRGMLEKLSEKLASAGIGNVRTRLWNLEADPFPEAGFDLVVSSMTLHHLRDVPLVFNRLAETLKPGGWLAVADLDTEDGSFHSQADDVFHHGFDRQQVADWLRNSGFASIRVGDAHKITKPGPTGESRSYGVFLAVAQVPETLCP